MLQRRKHSEEERRLKTDRNKIDENEQPARNKRKVIEVFFFF